LLLQFLEIGGLFFLFGFSHTILASNKIKKSIAEKLGGKIAFYRLFYNVSSAIIIAALLAIAPKPSARLYDLQFPYDIIIFTVQVVSLIGLILAARYIDVGEFLGTAQLKRYFSGTYNVENLDEDKTLIIKGPFKYVRHPIYFGSIIFLGARPTMDLFYFSIFFYSIIYFYIGSVFEEKKLVEEFGEKYKEYQTIVPRLFPYKFWNINRQSFE